MQQMNDGDVALLCERMDPSAWVRDIEVNACSERFFRRMEDILRKDRFGEVIFLVERPNGKFISITCAEYPQGTFRVPTGGVGYGEDIQSAVQREVMEELGLQTEIRRFAGVLRIRFRNAGETVTFYSFLFHLVETGGNVLVDATEDEVMAIREETPEEMVVTAKRLDAMDSEWKGWGHFRYITTLAAAQYAQEVQSLR